MILGGILLFGAVLMDYWLGWAWWPPYFRRGVLVYRTAIPIPQPRTHPGARFLATAIDLEGAFDDVVGRLLTFQQLGENEIAFRKAFLRFPLFRVPVTLHGVARLEPATDEVVVEGRANWIPLGLVLLATGVALGDPEIGLMLPLATAGFLIALSIPQFSAFRRIGEFMAGRPS